MEVAIEFGGTLPDWVSINSVQDLQKQQLLELQVDKGEASAIALALEINSTLLVLDDLKARSVARQLKLNITGTLGIIIKAKNAGFIASIKPLLNEIKKTDFRLSPEVANQALSMAGEI